MSQLKSKIEKIFSTNLRVARKRRGLSIVELARELEINRGSIHRWENGDSLPIDGHMLDRMHDVLGVPPGHLFAENLQLPNSATEPHTPKITIKDALQTINDYPGKIVLKIADRADLKGWTTKSRVLVIEDDDFILKAIIRDLEKEGLEVFGMGDGKKALEFLHHHDVDLVISDNFLPNVSGRRIMQWLMDNKPETLRVIASGTLDTKEIEKVQPHAFFPKPYKHKDLISTVTKLLSQRIRKAESY